MQIRVTGTDLSMMNAIRRVVISEVPTMAIDMISMEENTSTLAGEFLAHRLGLVPLISHDVGQFKYTRDCDNVDCAGACDMCSVSYHLDVMCDSDETTMVTTEDLRPDNTSSSVRPYVINDDMPILIAKLRKNQHISMMHRLTAI